MTKRMLIWNEYLHEKENPDVAAIYPDGIHLALKSGLEGLGWEISTATLQDPEHGLTEEALAATDVLVWWGHKGHHRVEDDIVERVQQKVLAGMGLVVLHSGHMSKIFRKLMGTSGRLKWRDQGEKERLWVVDPSHPIAEGIGTYIELEREEMYGEPFDIPAPDELIFVSWFAGGEVFRSGCTFRRGKGKIFYFRPGHETFPTYKNETILKVIGNGIRWAAPSATADPVFGNVPSIEPI